MTQYTVNKNVEIHLKYSKYDDLVTGIEKAANKSFNHFTVIDKKFYQVYSIRHISGAENYSNK
jgi:hypothetical protein